MEKHLSRLENISMKKPFCEESPEFRDVRRFERIFGGIWDWGWGRNTCL
jgi:hypothetical protein